MQPVLPMHQMHPMHPAATIDAATETGSLQTQILPVTASGIISAPSLDAFPTISEDAYKSPQWLWLHNDVICSPPSVSLETFVQGLPSRDCRRNFKSDVVQCLRKASVWCALLSHKDAVTMWWPSMLHCNPASDGSGTAAAGSSSSSSSVESMPLNLAKLLHLVTDWKLPLPPLMTALSHLAVDYGVPTRANAQTSDLVASVISLKAIKRVVDALFQCGATTRLHQIVGAPDHYGGVTCARPVTPAWQHIVIRLCRM